MGVVYLAKNKINGKCYVGKTITTLERRKKDHEKSARRKPESYFQRSLLKYGFDYFDWIELFCGDDDEILKQEEMWFIKELKTKKPNGYNLTDGGDGNSGWVHSEKTKKKLRDRIFSEETRRKMSESASKKPPRVQSEQERKKRSENRRGVCCLTPDGRRRIGEAARRLHTGRKKSEETRRKQSEALKGKSYHSEKQKEILRNLFKGKSWEERFGKERSLEMRKKVSEAGTKRKGEKRPPSTGEKIRAKALGRKASEEAKRNMSAARKGKKHSPETKKKMSEARIAWFRKKSLQS